MKGWYGQPLRHSLSSKGIRTSFGQSKVQKFHKQNDRVLPKELFLKEDDYKADNIDRIIQLFWWCSKYNQWEWFNFDKAFDVMKGILELKLGRINGLPEEDLRRFWLSRTTFELKNELKLLLNSHPLTRRKLIKTLKENIPKEYSESDIDYILYEAEVDEEDLRKAIVEVFVEDSKDVENVESWTEEYDDMREKYKKLKNILNQRSEKIVLFDSMIDLAHHYGLLLEDWMLFTVPQLRRLTEEEYL